MEKTRNLALNSKIIRYATEKIESEKVSYHNVEPFLTRIINDTAYERDKR